MNKEHEFEEHESVPWSNLVAEVNQRPILVYVAVAVMLALALGLVAARTFLRSDPIRVSEIEAPPTTAATPDVAPVPTTTTIASLISEADLMAASPPELASVQMATTAEVFVTNFFTFDGDDSRRASLAGHIPVEDTEPLVGGHTYVEWARTWAMEPSDSGFQVTVVFRTISDLGNGFVRDPVRAVSLDLVQTPGGPRVSDLPRPVVLDAAPAGAAWPPLGEVPPEVAAEAAALAAPWGTGVEVVGGTATATGWRVQLIVEDHVGARWPMAIRLDQ